MKILNKYPELAKQFEEMYKTRRNEILNEMLETDDKYKKLCRELADSSMKLKGAIVGSNIDELFEIYSDMAYARDAYELDIIYKRGIEDSLTVLVKNGLI